MHPRLCRFAGASALLVGVFGKDVCFQFMLMLVLTHQQDFQLVGLSYFAGGGFGKTGNVCSHKVEAKRKALPAIRRASHLRGFHGLRGSLVGCPHGVLVSRVCVFPWIT